VANLKDIRRRIKSVQSTRKITQAMKMVAAAKVKRAETRVKANRTFSNELRLVFRDVYEAMKNQQNDIEKSIYASLLTDKPLKNVGVVVISSDRGLCGSYNASVLKQTVALDQQLKEEGYTPKYFLVGNKIIRSFATHLPDSEALGKMGDLGALPTLEHAEEIAQALFQAFHLEQIDAIKILFTHFHSLVTYRVTLMPVLPLKGLIEEVHHSIPSVEDVYAGHITDEIEPETVLEPSPVKVLDALLPQYLTNQIYRCLLESVASELAARMTAMSNASNNAADMITKLTLQYNKARQASITQEILEIVSGAEAL
jgi:F-type H+-transporting ATPase subunit gamma